MKLEVQGLNLPIEKKPKVLKVGRRSPMGNRVTEQEVNDQGTFTDELDGSGNQCEDLGDFLDHVELGVLVAIRRGRVYEIHGGQAL